MRCQLFSNLPPTTRITITITISIRITITTNHQDHRHQVIESEQKILVGGILKFHAQLEKVDGYDHVIFPPVYHQVIGDDDDYVDDEC